MSNSVDRLTEIVLPPAAAATVVDWEEAVRVLRTALPTDYRRLVERYGGGQFDGYLWLLEPASRSVYDLTAVAQEREHFEMGCAEFLVATLTGEVRSNLFWSRYPADPHTFLPSRLIGSSPPE